VVVQVRSDELMQAFDYLDAGDTAAVVSLHLAAPKQEPVVVRNVAGLLRGFDPALKDQYVLVTAHYDHLGAAAGSNGDRVNNGANDNASGTAAIIELASAFSAMNPRPKRSILFLAFFGEEKGMLGSRYYTLHPLAPLRNTVANINLEVLGRTDDNEGRQVSKLSMTGYGYSDITTAFQIAGRLTGVEIPRREKDDAFFTKSDSFQFARIGIPAHTVAAVYLYPDYHRPGDEWQKLDYQNMAKITRMIGTAVRIVANRPNAPKWNQADPKAAPFIKAVKEH
jgi:Zn-dependent M28 family amino/carboxypeptidase